MSADHQQLICQLSGSDSDAFECVLLEQVGGKLIMASHWDTQEAFPVRHTSEASSLVIRELSRIFREDDEEELEVSKKETPS